MSIANIKSSVIEASSSEKFLGITVDRNFTFEKHTNEFCRKGNSTLHALARCVKFMTNEKVRLISKAFIIPQFNCPLVWMFHTNQLKNRINILHEKAITVYESRINKEIHLSLNY